MFVVPLKVFLHFVVSIDFSLAFKLRSFFLVFVRNAQLRFHILFLNTTTEVLTAKCLNLKILNFLDQLILCILKKFLLKERRDILYFFDDRGIFLVENRIIFSYLLLIDLRKRSPMETHILICL